MNHRESKVSTAPIGAIAQAGATGRSVSGSLTLRDVFASHAGRHRRVGTARLRADGTGEILLEDLGLRLELRAPAAPAAAGDRDPGGDAELDEDDRDEPAELNPYPARDFFTR